MLAAELLSAYERAESTEVKVKVLERLMALGPDALPALGRMVAALDDPEPLIREWAAEVLARLRTAAFTAGPKLMQNARHHTPKVRAVSLWALGEIGYRPGSDVLAMGIQDSHPDVRRWAVSALRMLGAWEVALAVVPLLRDPSAAVRRSAVLALGSLATDGAHDPRAAQIQAIQGRQPVTPQIRADALEALWEALFDADLGVVQEVFSVLTWFKVVELEATGQRLDLSALQARTSLPKEALQQRIDAVFEGARTDRPQRSKRR